VIPATAKAGITDGQHRRSGVSIALDEMPEEIGVEFGQDAVAVMVTCETDIDRIHQDFADASKTKALPSSLLALYDRRNPANRLVIDMEKECRLFNGRIDTTSKTLSKRSTFLFLANQVRQMVKELLAGSYALPDADFEQRAKELLSTERQHQRALETYSGYINHLAEVIPVWREIAELPVGELESSQIPQKRQDGWICLTATGLNLIGRIGHELFSSGERNWKAYADRLGAIDWRRSAEHWQGNIVQNNKMMTQQAPLKAAVARVKQEIGWAPVKPEGADVEGADVKDVIVAQR
jgi:DGQHR domain-containing protein